MPVRKASELVGLFFFIYTLVFLAVVVLPLDPVREILGPNAGQAAVDELRQTLGLDRPFWERYFVTLQGFLTGDLGNSVYYRKPVTDIVWETMPLTLIRFFAALLLGAVTGILAALLMALWKRGRGLEVIFQLSFSVPAFVLMIVVLLTVNRWIGITPSVNRVGFEVLSVISSAVYCFGAVGAYLSARLRPGAYIARRWELLQMLRAPHWDALLIILREAFPGILSVIANSATSVMTAVTFSEYVFGIPGFAVVFIDSTARGDLLVVAFGSAVLAVLFVLLQNLADLVSKSIDARMRS